MLGYPKAARTRCFTPFSPQKRVESSTNDRFCLWEGRGAHASARLRWSAFAHSARHRFSPLVTCYIISLLPFTALVKTREISYKNQGARHRIQGTRAKDQGARFCPRKPHVTDVTFGRGLKLGSTVPNIRTLALKGQHSAASISLQEERGPISGVLFERPRVGRIECSLVPKGVKETGC